MVTGPAKGKALDREHEGSKKSGLSANAGRSKPAKTNSPASMRFVRRVMSSATGIE